MRVLLLEPPKVPWPMMGDVVAPPLGLAQLAACLELAGIPVEIFDANALGTGWKNLEPAISRAAPDLIGMTVYTPYFPEVARAVRAARRAAPQATIVLGGPHVTFTARETLESIPEVDIVALGEGDRTIVDLAAALDEGRDLLDVRGIVFRDVVAGDGSHNGQVSAPAEHARLVETSPADPVDVTQLPVPAYHLLPMARYNWPELGGPFATAISSRGCPFRCTFCSEWPFWGPGWRPYDPAMVVEQLAIVADRYGRRNVWFGDDCFNVSREHMAAICEGILERGIDVKWYYQGRADLLVRHKDLLPLLHRAGNRMVQIGIEASSEEQRAELEKRLETSAIEEAVSLLRQYDIFCQGMMIVGTPSDSPRTFRHKVRFVKRLDVDLPIFTMYTLFPGTQVRTEAVEKGLIEQPEDYACYDMAHALLPTDHMTRDQVWINTGWAFLDFYFDPINLPRGVFARNPLKRACYRRMLSYIGRQLIKSLVPRFW